MRIASIPGRTTPLVLLLVAVSCQSDRISQSNTPSYRGPRAAASGGCAWPNEPAGASVVTDYGFADSIPKGSGQPVGNSGWYVYYNDSGYVAEKADTTAPCSAPAVAQFTFPSGLVGGSAPGQLYIVPGYTKQVYFGFWWKASNPWQDAPTTVLAIIKTGNGSSMVDMVLNATGGTPARQLTVQTQFSGIPSVDLVPNVADSNVSLGVWHQVEWYLKYSTDSTSSDGTIRWWIDGVEQGNYTDVNMPEDSGFGGYFLDPDWNGSSKTETDEFWYDHVHISVPSTAASWPNEPAGGTPISDYGFGDALPSGQGMAVGTSGWYINNPGEGGCGGPTGTLASELTNRNDAPLSPPDVGQWSYPVGFTPGCAPATMYYDHAAAKEVYAGFWWEPSNPWQSQSSNVNKIAFWQTPTNGSSADIQMYGQPPSIPFVLHAYLEFPNTNDNGVRLTPNVNSTTVTLGQWHLVEWHMKYATDSASGDGLVEWWLDGVLQGRYTNVQTPNDAGFYEFQVSPTWGGMGTDTKTEQDYYWFDHVHLSHK